MTRVSLQLAVAACSYLLRIPSLPSAQTYQIRAVNSATDKDYAILLQPTEMDPQEYHTCNEINKTVFRPSSKHTIELRMFVCLYWCPSRSRDGQNLV